ncbi:hypothetical protein LTR84_006939 [Exophiala bonariae]|uniref:Uncharacterized protein n=1 Tax=Exophiala bonariae TaxID=1690606 RepID=A0AAV9MZI6_9EURO|nr:hypothetical protein LTR84_006939 [Exophiala bonariae]
MASNETKPAMAERSKAEGSKDVFEDKHNAADPALSTTQTLPSSSGVLAKLEQESLAGQEYAARQKKRLEEALAKLEKNRVRREKYALKRQALKKQQEKEKEKARAEASEAQSVGPQAYGKLAPQVREGAEESEKRSK